jgi:3-oxocholest-4-en-26-oate---CoA ligase
VTSGPVPAAAPTRRAESPPRTAASFNLADLFESVADRVPDRPAVVMGDERLTYAVLDDRAECLARHLADRGVGPGSMVGLQMENDPAYLATMLAAFKLRAVPVNVNHRYVAAELDHLYRDAGLHTLVLHRRFAAQAAEVARAAGVRHAVVVGDDSPDPVPVDLGLPSGQADLDAVLADDRPSARVDRNRRSGDDHYVVYTGGTTGAPKGVLWRHEDIFFAALGGGDPFQFGDWVDRPDQLVERVLDTPTVSLPTPPLMHASAQWLALHQLFAGGRVVLTPYGRFDPAEVLDLVATEGVTTLVVVGDAMVQPLVAELEAHPGRYDLGRLLAVGSGGARLSPHLVQRFTALAPHVIVVDAFGSSETGTLGSSSGAGTARFTVGPQTAVLGADHTPVAPGSDQVGLLARTGHVPIGYLHDPDRTAATIVTAGGRRWVLTGDQATVGSDGTVTLLGRGSSCINTGGEKVYPEEVEVACTSHPDVTDAVVVGVPDDRWGERIVAVVAPAHPGSGRPALADLQDHCRTTLARFKVPRQVVLVERIERTPAGKPDQRWARETAMTAPEEGTT